MAASNSTEAMRIHISGRHIHITDALRDYVQRKVSKAQKYFDHLIWAQVILSVEKAHQIQHSQPYHPAISHAAAPRPGPSHELIRARG